MSLNREYRRLSIKADCLHVHRGNSTTTLSTHCESRVTAISHNLLARKLEFSGLPGAVVDLRQRVVVLLLE